MHSILKFLEKHGESLESDIAEAVGISLANAHARLSQLSASGQVMSYHSSKLEDGIKIEGMRYRITRVLIETRRVRADQTCQR